MPSKFFEVRLRFKKLSDEKPDELVKKFEQMLEAEKEHIVGRINRHHIAIRIPENKRHFWSPQLSVNLEETEEATEIRGLYGPKPDIWLMYMFIYFFLGFITMVVTVVGLSRHNLGLSSYILWAIPVVLGGVLALWISSQAGQRLGKDETNLIHDLVTKYTLQDARDEE
jgi:hypothetical protein